MSTNAIRLAGSASARMLLPIFQQQPASQSCAAKGAHCFKQFFTSPTNKLARFVGNTKSLDKCFKLGKAVSECAVGIIEDIGVTGDPLTAAQNTQKALKTAREVIALANVLNGAIPSIVNSSQRCYQYTSKAWALGNNEQTYEDPQPYNKMLLNRSDYLWAAAKEASIAISATTYSTTFGILRPLMLINKLTPRPFLDKAVSHNFGMAVAGIMAINHVAGVTGGACNLVLEQRMYRRAKESLHAETSGLDNDALLSAERGLRAEHTAVIKNSVLTMIEKALELVVDAIKFIPLPITTACGAALSGAFTAASSAVGLYAIWQRTKSGN
ncbi:hypothetical protein C10C_0612 [Chlamydia serpentis]|uniref:Uncharacterized protein n=1 Tax=Chlamydia serpentis TaxID=1967782 RepID=A0A2R8FBI9_9CHLA|nr:hypothetical protein [Chlamydia serpentis]SPN73768.1 hypothetical protein C10C_0612 [Chlamydia serpentis]